MNGYKTVDNPYTLQFSYVPPKHIERAVISNEIIENFTKNIPTYRGMFITGVRGSGKTVMLSDIRNKIVQKKDWITVDINPESDLLDSLARALYLIPELKALFVKAKLDFSVLGIGVHLERADLVASNEEDALVMMLRTLKKAGKKLLITVDEITYSKDVARFSHALSSYASEDYDVYVLMTGLSDNIAAIKNKKSLTFLYRAKVRELDALNITAIRADYQKTLGFDRSIAEMLAYATRGYSLAFQALGYHCWNAVCNCKERENIDLELVLNELDMTLAEMAYDKIWDELSDKDREVLSAMNDVNNEDSNGKIKVEAIREKASMTSDVFTKYRKRLIDDGIIESSNFGYVRFRLPRMEEYISSITG